MRINKNKILATSIAIFLVLSAGISLTFLPTSKASTTQPANLPTYAYINVAPNPTGVNQRVLVIMWLTNLFSPESGIGNNYRFHNYILTITPPNGTKDVINFPVVNDSTSAQDYSYLPTQAGQYNFNFTFPGQPFNEYAHDTQVVTLFGVHEPEPYLNDTYLPSHASTNLTVLSTPIPAYPTTPLPTSFWTRPIYGENPNWYTIASNWLGSGSPVEPTAGTGAIGAYGANSLFTGAALNRNPGDAVGSLISHIMWTKPLQQGGIVGGNNFLIQGDSYFEGSAYIQRYDNPIIIDGILYYQAPLGYNYPIPSTGSGGGTYAVNLVTGQQLWYNPNIPAGALSFGYVYDAQNPNQKGVIQPVLFTSGFGQAYDAWTGTYLFNVTNIPSGGPLTMGPNGEVINYIVQGTRLLEWNSSNLWNWNVETGGGAPTPNTGTFNVTSINLATGKPVTATYHNTVNGRSSPNVRLEHIITIRNSKHLHTNRSHVRQPDSMRKRPNAKH